MSVLYIRQALETALATILPEIATAYENQAFEPPPATTAYQIVDILFAEPENIEFGSGHRELGYMQVRLMYPLQVGAMASATRAEAIRTKFYRGASFAKSGIIVIVEKTPEIQPARVEGDRYVTAVKVRFFANIH